jgi:PIN domain nuclease of toxin-antitoxin system
MITMDTCAIVWDALQPAKLSASAKKAIKKADDNNELLMCDISIWEISMLVKRKRIEVDETPANLVRLILDSRNYTVVSISPEIAELSVNLDAEINSDPADRLIAATSILKQAPIVTADQNLREASIVDTIW